jgi:hypothetical protein
MNYKKKYSAAITYKYLPHDDLIRSKHVAEVSFIRKKMDGRGWNLSRGNIFFFTPQRPYRLWEST